jgi:hypothetical protein
MAHTFDELRHKTIGELRAIAQGLPQEAVQGFTQMNKERLLQAICKALHIEMHAHHDVVGIDKSSIKARIRSLKEERDAALDAHDSDRLKAVRRQIHTLKRRIHRATV